MEVEVIKAKDISTGNQTVKRNDKLRVAAYCRVSTDDEEQIKSYESMVAYYKDYIMKNSEWQFVEVYADKAVTGTKAEKREGFQRLIGDCMAGKIDLVIAKSLSRFARNTLDTLKYVRMLKEKGVAVLFEVEKINTLKDGEFLMTILSSVAQQEVENTSAYVKKGLRMKMKRGELVGFQGCIGYDYDPEKKAIYINEEGAEIVRYIFERYNQGAGSTMIARELNEKGYITLKGNPWRTTSVMSVIKNEKYMGDLILGKTFTVDPITKRRLENLGEEDKYYIRNHHEPIVSEEVFRKAQDIRERRNGGRKAVTPGKREKFSRQYAFSCMIECGFCKSHLTRRRWHSSSKYKKSIWQCCKATKDGKRFCPESKGIPEEVIELAFIESYRNLCLNDHEVINEFLDKTEKALSEDSLREKLSRLNRQASNIKSKRKRLLDRFLDETVAQDAYEELDHDLERKLTNLNAQIKMLDGQLEDEVSLKSRIDEFREALSGNGVLEEFDRNVFESIVEKVIVGGYNEENEADPYKVTFVYKTGFKDDLYKTKDRFKKKSSENDRLDKGTNNGNRMDDYHQRDEGTELNSKLCSNSSNEVRKMCSDSTVDTCGDCRVDVTG